VLLMMPTGRIAGISGILAGCFALVAGDRFWRLTFIAGLIVAPMASGLAGYPLPKPLMSMSWATIVLAGFLVGLGARIGGGCTSGHGVCGIARLSIRSMIATGVFMGTAMIVVAIVRHGLGAFMLPVASFGCGLIFGAGLLLTGMTQPAKVLGFLDVLEVWDPTLAFVMAAALLVSFVGFRFARQRAKPVLAAEHLWPTRTEIDPPPLIGSALFGVGWGLVGLCPGPALVNLATLMPQVIVFVVAMAAGLLTKDLWDKLGSTGLALGTKTTAIGSDG
jgi:uncharacterized protein